MTRADDPFTFARTEGFRDVPERITPACLGYVARIIEVRSFINLYFNAVKSSAILLSLVPPDALAKMHGQGPGQGRVVGYDYSEHRQFVNEIMLTRAVESFDLYVLTVLRDLFANRPDMLKSESPVDAATVIGLRNFDDIVRHLAERRLHELAYKPLSELEQYILSRTGIPLFKHSAARDAVVLATEVRNLIAHNDCKINEHFKRRTSGIEHDCPVDKTGKFIVEDDWLRRVCYTLDGVIFDFDSEAILKFDLKSASERGFVLDR